MILWRRTIFSQLFLVFSAIVVAALTTFGLISYSSMNERLSSQAVGELLVLSRSLVANLDAQLQNMNRINIVPTASPSLRRELRNVSFGGDHGTLLDMMSNINGSTQDVRQFNIYHIGGWVAGVGYRNAVWRLDVQSLPWFSSALAAGGQHVIFGPHIDTAIASDDSPDRDRRYVSLCRYFSGAGEGGPWMLEVEEDCSDLFQELDIISKESQNGRRFAVINDQNQLIYPYRGNLADRDWIVSHRPQDISEQVAESRQPGSGRPSVLVYTRSLEADWSLVVVQDKATLYPEIGDLTWQILWSALVVAVAALAGSYGVARRVSRPIRRLRAAMEGFSLDRGPVHHEIPAREDGLVELDSLVQAFGQLQSELHRSFAEAVLLKTHKHRAQLLALQSQMHPHFMFNMLATIAVMAEDGQAEAIPALVGDLAAMMRTIASSKDEGHRLGDEFDFIQRYLRCLKRRFGKDLQSDLTCPPGLEALTVPRLILEPVVENAVKHASLRKPPWKITVRAEADESHWWVVIEDNGAGLRPDRLESLRAELERLRGVAPDVADIPDLHIEGLGLLNTFSRLRLSYGDEAILELANREEGGAKVRIGGALRV